MSWLSTVILVWCGVSLFLGTLFGLAACAGDSAAFESRDLEDQAAALAHWGGVRKV